MPFILRPDPDPFLSGRPVIQAGDRRTMAEALERFYGVQRVGFAKAGAPFRAIANRASLDAVVLHYCSYSVDSDITFESTDGFRQFFQITGAGKLRMSRRDLELSRDLTAILPAGNFEASYIGGYSHLVLQLNEAPLRRSAEAFFGTNLPGRLGLGELAPRIRAHSAVVSSILAALAHQFSATTSPAPNVIAHLEQALLVGFITEHAAELNGRAVAPPKLGSRTDFARFEDYIRANWRKALTVEEVAAACGTSTRSVYAQFKQARGMSPATYMRGVRLDQANRLLREGDGDVSVLDVAMMCGFSSFGHFSRRYRERFGELPSVTLARRG